MIRLFLIILIFSSEKLCHNFGKFTSGLLSEDASLAKGIERSFSLRRVISKLLSLRKLLVTQVLSKEDG